MRWKSELEARLRRQADGYEERVPRRPDLEARILARAVSTPPLPARPTPLIRELAVAATFLLVAGAVGIGVIQLRAARQATENPPPAGGLPTLTYTPGIAVPKGPISLGSSRTGTTMHMFTPLRGWAVGPFEKGLTGAHDALLVTADGGSHWRNVTPPGFSSEFNRLSYFFDPSHGWVVITPAQFNGPPTTATITVFRTVDGGRSWQRGDFTAAGGPTEMDFVDARHGWLVLGIQNDTAIYRTGDGGAHWALVSQQPAPNWPYATQAPGTLPYADPFAPTNHSQLICQFEGFAGFAFHDLSTGWVTGDCTGPVANPLLDVTHDAGKTWQAQPLPPLPGSPKCPCEVTTSAPAFTSAQSATFSAGLFSVETICETQGTGSSCSTTGTPVAMFLYTTSDAGTTWTVHRLPGVSGGTPSFVDGRTGWQWASILKPTTLVPNDTAFDNLYLTHDGGATWTPLPKPSPGFLGGEMQFINSTTGWVLSAVGPAQTLLKTTDGGQSWRQLTPTVD